MAQLLTPGLYARAAQPVVGRSALARGDIAVMPGYAARGPVMVPVRLQSVSQFQEVFGPPVPRGLLWHSVKGFFECGGQVLYIIRVAEDGARAARADLGQGWRAEASFPWWAVDPRRNDVPPPADTAIWMARLDTEIRQGGRRRRDPGSWANGMQVEITRAARAQTQILPEVLEGGRVSRLAAIAGIDPGAVFLLGQTQTDPGTGQISTRQVARMAQGFDPATRSLRWHTPLAADGFDPTRAIQIETVEFDVTLWREGQSIARYAALSPSPTHDQALVAQIAQMARDVQITAPEGVTDWSDPAVWPPEGVFPFQGGTDRLEGITVDHWRQALAQIPTLEDASLITAPDLSVRADPLAAPAPPVLLRQDCRAIEAPQTGHIAGRTVRVTDTGETVPLPGVLVDVAGRGGTVLSDDSGAFAFQEVALDLATLRFFKEGFAPLEALAQPTRFAVSPGAFADGKVAAYTLTALSQPVRLPDDQVLQLQRDLANPAIVGPYKIAIVEHNRPEADLQALRSWGSELGPLPRLGLFGPWLRVADPMGEGGERLHPPGGHICGLFARAEIAGGVQRSGANLPLSYCEGVSVLFDPVEHGVLNAEGINVITADPGRGIRAMGTRSRALGTPWQFLPARRIVDAIERTLERGLRALVFEPNAPHLRHVLTTMVTGLLENAHRKGLLAGRSPAEAFWVKCDDENNPPEVSDNGQLIVDVALAPTLPAEFVLFRISHAFDALSITENRA